MIKVVRLLMYVVLAWVVWIAWGAVPFFSQGFGVGVSYVCREAQENLNDFALASKRLMVFARMRRESIDYPGTVRSNRAEPRRFEGL